MENLLSEAISSGNATSIIAALLVYLIIHVQRRSTGTERDAEIAKLTKEIHALNTEKELMQKDIDTLKEESAGIKEDIKEIKQTLQNISISIAKIAAKYDMKV